MSTGGSLDELMPIFCQSHYFVMLIINLVICVGINTGLDLLAVKDKGPNDFYVFSGDVVANHLVFSVIVSFFVFWNSHNQHKRIKAGAASPVTRRALCDNCFKRVILFSMQEPSWKKRIWLFMWQGFLFPGVFFVCVLALLCMFASGFDALSQSQSCQVSKEVYIVCIECWKSVAMVVIFSSMYAASHNEEQAELAEVVNGGGGNVAMISSGGSALGVSGDDLYANAGQMS